MRNSARVLLWKLEREKDFWKPIEDTPANRRKALEDGAMFFTNTTYSEEPYPGPVEKEDEFNLAVIRYGGIHVDIDAMHGEPQDALVLLHMFLDKVEKEYDIPKRCWAIYFSGSKGFHAFLAPKYICPEAEKGDRFLPKIYKRMMQTMSAGLEYGNAKIDMSIYCMGQGRQFRIPGVMRTDTPVPRCKIPLLHDEIDDVLGLSIKDMQALAMAPRVGVSPNGFKAGFSKKARRLYLTTQKQVRLEVVENSSRTKVMSDEQIAAMRRGLPACIKKLFSMEDYGPNGINFNQMMFTLLVPYFKTVGADLDYALDVAQDWLIGFNGSATYSTPEARIDHFKAQWSTSYAWKCSIAHAATGCDCVGCPVKDAKAAEDFEDFTEAAKQNKSAYSGAELMVNDFPEPVFAVPGLLTEGLNFLSGNPKMGKSWLALSTALAVATGREALGYTTPEPGQVLYLALEDTPRRLKSRIQLLLGYDARADLQGLTDIQFYNEWARMGEGGLENLAEYAKSHPRLKYVIIDTFARFRALSAPKNQNAYQIDYKDAGDIKAFADKHKLCVLCVHHLRKATADDVHAQLSGSQGLPGAADASLVLKRDRGSYSGQLHVTGRDIEEKAFAIELDKDTMNWSIKGEAHEIAKSEGREKIIFALKEYGAAMKVKDIAEATGYKTQNLRVMLSKMAKDGDIIRVGTGLYLFEDTGAPEFSEGF